MRLEGAFEDVATEMPRGQNGMRRSRIVGPRGLA